MNTIITNTTAIIVAVVFVCVYPFVSRIPVFMICRLLQRTGWRQEPLLILGQITFLVLVLIDFGVAGFLVVNMMKMKNMVPFWESAILEGGKIGFYIGALIKINWMPGTGMAGSGCDMFGETIERE